MADVEEQKERPSGLGGTLSQLAQIKIGPITINLRILLEPLAFLRIILVVMAMFSFALAAGYNSPSGANTVNCGNSTNNTRRVEVAVSYPFRPASYIINDIPGSPNCTVNVLQPQAFSSSAEFFVMMGVVTFLYCLAILPVYVFVYTPTLDYSKYVAVVDCIVSLIMSVLYFPAVIAWSAGGIAVGFYTTDSVLRFYGARCLQCTTFNIALQGVVQLQFSALFGWVVFVLWIPTVWFSYKESFIHIQKIGPIYSVLLPMISDKYNKYRNKNEQQNEQDTGGSETE